MVATDILADTNPAYCSVIIFQFCQGYMQESSEHVDFPLVLLPIPLVLSGELEKSFKNTRIDTGFFTWVDRNPDILIGLAERVQGTLVLTKRAVEFGVAHLIFEITVLGKICPTEKGLRKKINPSPSSKVGRVCKNALRMGQWFGQIRSTSTIYNHLGLEI